MADKGKAAPDKGAAALAEVNGNGKPKQITWKGLDIELPQKPPGTILWDLAALGDSQGLTQLRGATEIIRSVVGDSANEQVKEKVRSEGWDVEETVTALLDEDGGLLALVMGVFDMSTGESEASQKS
jgi:hypothetical protein